MAVGDRDLLVYGIVQWIFPRIGRAVYLAIFGVFGDGTPTGSFDTCLVGALGTKKKHSSGPIQRCDRIVRAFGFGIPFRFQSMGRRYGRRTSPHT